MSLAANEVPEQVYDSFWRPLEAGFGPAQVCEAEKGTAGLPELHMYDLFVPLAGGTDKRYPYEEGKRLILEGLKPLGEEYGKLLETGFSSRWIDVYENQGKRSGGYSRHVYGCHPYVLMSYTDSLDSVLTLAHEMGHSLHSWYSDHGPAAGLRRVYHFCSGGGVHLQRGDPVPAHDPPGRDQGGEGILIFRLLDRFRSVMLPPDRCLPNLSGRPIKCAGTASL